MTTELTLRAVPAPESESLRAPVRLQRSAMRAAGLQPGDAVELSARDRVFSRLAAGSVAAGTIALDARTLAAVGADWEDPVTLRRADLAPLQSVILEVDEGPSPDVQDLAEYFYDLPVSEGDTVSVPRGAGTSTSIRVLSARPTPTGICTEATSFSVAGHPAREPGFEGIGGLEAQNRQVQEMVATPLRRPDLFRRLGLSPPRGILFTGPPGTGKTLLARTVAARSDAAFFVVNGPEIVSKHYGDSEAALRNVFETATRSAPAIVFIDELDAIAPRREALSGEKQVERRIVAQLLTLLDGLEERGALVVMAATNLPDAIDPALRRPGRFDREVVFSVPNAAQRKEILQVHLGAAPLHPDVDLAATAAAATGYVGADLASLAREAGLAAIARNVRQCGSEAAVQAEELTIEQADIADAFAATRPSSLRQTAVEVPTVTWDDIGGHDTVKHQLSEAVLWPLRHQDRAKSLRLSAARGVLLAGPPGSGKTMIAQALANEGGMNFIAVRAPQILSQYFGEAERALTDMFTKARQAAPTMIFIDEIDAFAPKRGGQDAATDRIIAQLLVEMDGFQAGDRVPVLAATNRPDALDPALVRPGRFDLVITIPLPDTPTRQAILEVKLRGLPLADDCDPEAVANLSEGFSGASLTALVTHASRRAFARSLTDSGAAEIRQADLLDGVRVLSEARQAVAVNHLHSNPVGA